jgi:hypothetical protein
LTHDSLPAVLASPSTATVSDAELTNAAGTDFSATRGTLFSGTVATFVDPAGSEPIGDYTATIHWGAAGTGSNIGTIVDDGGGHFHVTGNYTYAEEGTPTVEVTLTHDSLPAILASPSTATVAARTLTIAGITANNKIYDGTTVAMLNVTAAHLVGVVGSDDVTLNAAYATGSFASADAATGISVTISGLVLEGAQAAEYTITPPTLTADITPASLTVSGITVHNKVYDGTTTAAFDAGNARLIGVVGHDDVALDATHASADFVSPDVGTDIHVTISDLVLTGAKAGDYYLIPPSGLAADITDASSPTVVVLSSIPDQTNFDGDTVSVQASATDTMGDPVTYEATDLPNGVTIDPNSGLISGTIDQAADASSPYSVTVTATDSTAHASDTTSFVWTVTTDSPQTGPLLVWDDLYFEVSQDQSLNISSEDLRNNILDSGGVVHIDSFSNPSHGTLQTNADESVTYLPDTGYLGLDDFCYHVSDGQYHATAYVRIQVYDNTPIVMQDAYYTVLHDQVLTTFAALHSYDNQPLGVLANDVSSHVLEVVSNTDPRYGTLLMNSDGGFSYTPDPGYFGTDVFSYTAFDGTNEATGNVTIDVIAPPLPTLDLSLTIQHDRSASDSVFSNGAPDLAQGETLSVQLDQGANFGTVDLAVDGDFTYMPRPGYVGPDSFTFTLSDGATSTTGSVSITVVDQPLISVDAAFSTYVNKPLTVLGSDPNLGILAHDSDPDQDPIWVADATQGKYGT